MKIFLDSANIEDIKKAYDMGAITGVTTNPSIISKERTDFWALLAEIRSIIGPDKMLHVQTVQKTAEGMIEEALLIKKKIGGNFFVKIPISEEGLKATMELKKLGIGVTVTAIFTPTQALMAATAGADFVAPYVNRLDNIISNGVEVASEIVKQFEVYKLSCQVLVASFKNAEQVHKCASVGCHSVTVTADILKLAISHPMTDAAVAGFEKDWKGAYGEKTILDF